MPAHPNSYQGEGIHVVRADTPFFKGDMLIHNNETCNSTLFAPSGASLWDVTDPANPKPLNLNFGDAVPAVANQTYHTTHSAQLFTQQGKVFAVLKDNDELADVDIFDVSNPAAPVLVAEQGLEEWPGAQGSYANGDTVNNHDFQFKRIGGHDYLVVSYWDAGQVLLNVDNPAAPVFVGDSDYRTPGSAHAPVRVPRGEQPSGVLVERQPMAHLHRRGLLAVPHELRDHDGTERRAVRCRRVRVHALDRQPAGQRRSPGRLSSADGAASPPGRTPGPTRSPGSRLLRPPAPSRLSPARRRPSSSRGADASSPRRSPPARTSATTP